MDEDAVVSLDDIQVDERLNYVDKQAAVLEREVKVLHKKDIPLVNV